MAINKIKCPECGAGLKSSDGFDVGQEVECPKCESAFVVEEPEGDEAPVKKKVKAVASRTDDDDDDDAPKKKKKKKSRDDDDEKSYKSSPARYAVLGILVVVMIVLGVMLVMKRNKDKETEEANAKIQSGENPDQQQFGPPPNLNAKGAKIGGGGPAVVPPPPPPPPLPGGGVAPKVGQPKNPPMVGGGGPAGGIDLFGQTPLINSPEGKQLMATLRQKLIGTWEGTGPDGAAQKVTYTANGQFTLEANGKTTSGAWQASTLVGGKVLKITRGTAALRVAFEGDELLHDTETPGISIVMKKK